MEYFIECMYTHDKAIASNDLDVYLYDDPNRECNDKSTKGFHCENCYSEALHDQFFT